MKHPSEQALPSADPRINTGDLPLRAGSPMASRLRDTLDGRDFAWLLGLTGENQASKLATLTGDLRRAPSGSGDGKRIASGFSYLGVESAIAWVNACRDYLYPVMKESIESFDRRWASIQPLLDGPYHYVSLGPGDGRKDAVILHELRLGNPDTCYVAVDMSAEMLRLGVQDVIRQLKLARSRVLAIQLDFSVPANVVELRRLLRDLFGDEPILFSLLGNTMANFENDAELLAMLANTLVRPQDRFLVEVATTQGLSAALVQDACDEYERSRTFREFITSTLMHYTDLHIDMDGVSLVGSVEKDRAILVKVLYRNRTGRKVRITLPDRTTVSFPEDDTIRLLLTRKYLPNALEPVLLENNIEQLGGTDIDFFSDPGARFGMSLLLLGSDRADAGPERSVADNIWRKG